MTPWLTPDEIDDLCKPLKQAAAQIRFMQQLGLTVRTKPNGKPIVMRSHVEQIMGVVVGTTQATVKCQPNRAALIERFEKRQKTKKQKEDGRQES